MRYGIVQVRSPAVIFRIVALAVGISALTAVHYLVNPDEVFFHVISRELYFLPIIIAGFWFGLRGGLAAALLCSLAYFPVAVGGLHDIGEHQLGNLLQIFLFNVIGILVGWLQDRELQHQAVLLEIEDFGDGIGNMGDNDMFEPFMTSKKEGTGLGLPIAKKIVEAHGGILEFEQKTDRGMIFRMVLMGDIRRPLKNIEMQGK